MTRFRWLLTGLMVSALMVGLHAQKTPLPAAVSTAFKNAYPNAKITNVSKEDGNYEVESMDGTQRRDLIYKPDGTVVEYEEFVETKDVPAAVVNAIKSRYPKAVLGQCEKLFKDTTMNYEAAIKGAGSVSSVVLTPAGEWISPKKSS